MMNGVLFNVTPVFVSDEIKNAIGFNYEGQCWLERPMGGSVMYQLGDYKDISSFRRRLSYQQVIDFFERNGFDISYLNLRRNQEHRFLIFKDGNWIKDIHVIVNDNKYNGYDTVFKLILSQLKS